MKILIIILNLLAGAALATDKIVVSNVSGSAPLKRAPWLEPRTYTYGPGVEVYRGGYNCGPMRHALTGHIEFGKTLVRQHNCYMKAMYFDIETKELIVEITMTYQSRKIASFLARLSGEIIDHYAELRKELEEADTTVDSLAKALNRMSRNGVSEFEDLQPKRFLNGHINVKAFSKNTKIMLDPNRGSIADGFGGHRGMRIGFQNEKDRYYNPHRIRVEERNPQNFSHIQNLYNITRKSTEILKNGLRELELGTDADTVAAFKAYIAEPVNAKIMAAELKALRAEIGGQKNYHALEILHFLNEFSQIVSSIDKIIKGKEGTSPGFISTINKVK